MASIASQCMVLLLCLGLVVSTQGYIADSFETYSSQGIYFDPSGSGVTISLNEGQTSCAMATKEDYLYGEFGAYIKLPGGNAAGTVATFYMTSPFPQQCEYDFEFLGNVEGGNRKIHTNIFVDGKGGREQQIYMPGDFDPTANFHYYSFQWHQDQLVFYVDWKPIRQFKNLKDQVNNGTYCDHKAMNIKLSIWDGSKWATDGGAIKIDWSQAPFNCNYQNFNFDGCPVPDPSAIGSCQMGPYASGTPLTSDQYSYLQGIKSNETLVVYNYCTDYARYPNLDEEYPECKYNAM